MGLLSEGAPLTWPDTAPHTQHVREHGVTQFISLYNRLLNRDEDQLKWGDEIEYMVVTMDKENKTSRLSMRAQEMLPELMEPELRGEENLDAVWRPEYASYMIEGTPGGPYGNDLNSLNNVERNMAARRKEIIQMLHKDEIIVSMSIFPRLGVNPFTKPESFATPEAEDSFTKSLWWPNEGTYGGHPRFKTLTSNIRQRRGEKVAINVPLYKDEKTPKGTSDAAAALPGHIYMDAMGFGMGLSCLQVTFQACNMTEAENLYDQLAPLCPIFLALSASSPIFRGYLADVDCRWDIISASVDCRTRGERGLSPLKPGEKRIQKSRYASISSYLSEKAAAQADVYNDVELVHDEKSYERLVQAGVQPLMAKHISHLFIRDTVSLFLEKLHQDDTVDTDHFENIQSTNWQTMRFKPPPPNSSIGWRVEFRPCELQFTDFESAATCCFIVLLTRAILTFKYNLLVPISLVDDNMKRCQVRDAVHTQRFHFRTNLTAADGEKPEIKELTLNEIVNGSGEFIGLIPIVEEYLRDIEGDSATMCTLSNYWCLMRNRASGELQTNAAFIRDFVTSHPDYMGDSRVSDRINFDLMEAVAKMPETRPKELFGDLKIRTF